MVLGSVRYSIVISGLSIGIILPDIRVVIVMFYLIKSYFYCGFFNPNFKKYAFLRGQHPAFIQKFQITPVY